MNNNQKPTYAQIECAYRWMSWRMPTALAQAAAKYLETRTRKEVSKEMQRLKKLYDSHNLSKDTCFESDIWNDFSRKEREDA